ncbi:MAG: AAA family ATPase [Lachnospiraceae bacterium]
MERKRLPVGIENFAEIRKDNYYYVDKTRLLEQLLTNLGKANLYTRPRRFGKSLNMSMLRYFFEIGTNPTLFDGLYISKNKELCEQNMGKFPVISISLKDINSNTFEGARDQVIKIINREARRLRFIMNSDKLDETDRQLFESLLKMEMQDATIENSLRDMSELLEKHYDEKVIILIDEYDVPLAKANEQGYYDEMVLLIRNLFSNALKTNDSLKFAVLTGCLRVAKESIFTGLNNFNVFSITDVNFDEYFGFTDEEVKELLHVYNQDDHYEIVKEWYDGYRFGNAEVYCPWDVIKYCSDHINNPNLAPQNYWSNTSGNEVLYHFIDSMGEEKKLTKMELERLVNGGIVQKEISQELTYKELYDSTDNIWSTLFMTGYLTKRGEPDGNRFNLVVPNREIRNILTQRILKLFKEDVKKDGEMVNSFCNALLNRKPETVEQLFTDYMRKTVSVRDTFVKKPTKENFYHGILLGILSYKGDWLVQSNREAGDGFSDILIWIDDSDIGIVIEVKYAQDGDMAAECQKAVQQMKTKRYEEAFEDSDVHTILKYAIACNRKSCCVVLEGE